MSMYYQGVSCCGVREAGGLSSCADAEAAMRDFAAHFLTENRTNWRYLVFSQAGGGLRQPRYGDNFAAYIRKHRLGDVIETGTHVNPNSGNPLKIFVWTVDWDALRAHYETIKTKTPGAVLGLSTSTGVHSWNGQIVSEAQQRELRNYWSADVPTLSYRDTLGRAASTAYDQLLAAPLSAYGSANVGASPAAPVESEEVITIEGAPVEPTTSAVDNDPF